MKKVLLAILALIVLSINQVQAATLSRFSDDSRILSALGVLQSIQANDVFSRLDRASQRIIFYDLSQISFSYAKHFAVSSTDENGDNYILINDRFRNSPKEAIACLIAHESVHVLPRATLDEEVRATTAEAQTWIKVRSRVSSTDTDDLTNRLNRLANLYTQSTNGNDLIRTSILNNSFYQAQLAMK